MKRFAILSASVLVASAGLFAANAQDTSMSFFVTSQGPGDGANLGGLEGADAHCTSLAEAADSSGKTWAAYLSTDEADAKDRIGSGPWFNAKGEKIADDVASLHAETNAINKETALNEKGEVVNGRGDEPNRHDILTGSNRDGTAHEATCENWTSNGEGSAMTGHHDLIGNPEGINFWNFSHASQGCSQEGLQGTGGDGLLYCFATN